MGILYHVIKNPNYRPQHLDSRDPSYVAPEGYCPTDSYTTQINRRGECRECGTEVRESHKEG